VVSNENVIPRVVFSVVAVGLMGGLIVVVVISDLLVKMPYVDGELPVYWWDSEADRCMIIGIFRHGMCFAAIFDGCSVLSKICHFVAG